MQHFLLLIIAVLCSTSTVYAQESCAGFTLDALRLTQTPTITQSHAGRVEICQLLGALPVWGTIVTDNAVTYWSEKNGQVACKQLGFDGFLNVIFTDTIPLADRPLTTTPIHIENVLCDGTEVDITECNHRPIGLLHDTVFNDIYIVCRPTFSDSYSELHTGGVLEGDIRLVGDTRDGYGAVEIYSTLLGWSSICPDEAWTRTDVDAMCDQLGYESGTAVTTYTGISPSRIAPRQLYNTDCSGGSGGDFNSRRIGDCHYSISSFNFECSEASDSFAGIQCLSNADTGDIRLFGGSHSGEGIVEIFLNRRWGVICGDNWGTFDSDFNDVTVCSQLGLNVDNARFDFSSSYLEAESSLKPLWLEGVDCADGDSSLLFCSISIPVGYASCSTFDNLAAVNCGDPPSTGLSSGAITGIVFAVFIVVFFVLPFGWVYGKGYWQKRHEYGWYNTLTTPSSWCDCDCTFRRTTWSPPRRSDDSSSAAATVTITTTAEISNTNDSSVQGGEPEPEPQPGDTELTKVAPPSYTDASSFPTPRPEDLPPPYSGGLAANFAYPPPAGGAGYQGYPAPTFEPPSTLPSAPPTLYPVSTTLDPAYPPPGGQSSALPYPTDRPADPAYPPQAPPSPYQSAATPYPPDP